MGKIYLYGASGHGKVIAEIVENSGGKVAGIFDDNEAIQTLLGYTVESFPASFDVLQDSMIISIGNNRIRKKIAGNVSADYATAIHPFSHISIRTRIGEGTVVMGGVVVNADVQIGRHCIINTNASVDHDCVLGDFVHISPNVALCGNVTIGEGTHVGAGAVVIPGVTIGKWCSIGAGTVVIKDIPDFATAVGNPSKIIKLSNTVS